MELATHKPGLGGIYAVLSHASNRPRCAFLVLQLIAALAGEQGHAGPIVKKRGQGDCCVNGRAIS